MCTVIYFHFIMKWLTFSIIRPSHGFSFRTTAVNVLYNNLSSCSNLGSVSVYCLQMPFAFSLYAINDSNWFFRSFVSLAVDDSMLYEATTSIWLWPLWSLLIISSFWGIIKVTYFLLAAVPYLPICGFFEVIVMAWWAQ